MSNYLTENRASKIILPSNYWFQNIEKYPKLSVLAKKYLSPLPTSAYSERCFSMAAKIISKKRCRLCPEMAEMFLFLNKNINLCSFIK
jgi:hypothetical protein